MKARRWLSAHGLAIAAAMTMAGGVHARAAHHPKIDPSLADAMRGVAPEAFVEALVYFTARADLDRIGDELEVARAGRKTRHETVVRSLRETAAATQAPMRAHLDMLRAAGAVRDYVPLWIINGAWIEATPAAVDALAARPDVERVYHDYQIARSGPVEDAGAGGTGSTPEAGLVAIGAPEVWQQGITGAGVLVANIDSGVDGSHPALDDRWRGHDPSYAGHPEWAFFDPLTGWTFPHDEGSHGTHTMGTICGGLPGDRVGVAPGAEWISAAVVGRNGSGSKTGHIIQALQWLLDPDGDPSTDHDVPDVCNNSWTGGDILTPPCDPLFWSFLDACEEAGIVMVFSAGNGGMDGVMRPADRERTLAVAAVDAGNPGFPLASFSSRGPSFCTSDGSAMVKPDIAAPGVQVRSSEPGGAYGAQDGTSMAAPHVTGVVALMLEANPDLSVAQVKEILFDTAVDLGLPGKDNGFGWGLVDAAAAVQRALATPALSISTPDGLPDLLDPNGGSTVRVVVDGTVASPMPGSGKLHYATSGGSFTVDMLEFAPDEYEAVFPPFDCGERVTYAFSVETSSGVVVFDPPTGGPVATYVADAYDAIDVAFSDDFESDRGWTVVNGPDLESGAWERGVPAVLSGSLSVPSDADGSGKCFATGLENSTYVAGTTVLVSPVMDATVLDEPTLIYWRWCKTYAAPDALLRVDLSSDGGDTWMPFETVEPTGSWVFRELRVADVVPVTSAFRMRLVASHTGVGALDAALDGVRLSSGRCWSCSAADFDGSGDVGFPDLTQLLGAWGACSTPCAEDLDGHGAVGFTDLTALLGFWGPCA